MNCKNNAYLLKTQVQTSLTGLGGECKSLVVQVKIPTGSLSFTIQGRLSSDFDYITLNGVNISTLTTVTPVVAAGIYQYDISGMSDIKMTTSSTLNDGMIVYATALH